MSNVFFLQTPLIAFILSIMTSSTLSTLCSPCEDKHPACHACFESHCDQFDVTNEGVVSLSSPKIAFPFSTWEEFAEQARKEQAIDENSVSECSDLKAECSLTMNICRSSKSVGIWIRQRGQKNTLFAT